MFTQRLRCTLPKSGGAEENETVIVKITKYIREQLRFSKKETGAQGNS